ncbi:MAG: SAM-dependent methyltransferase [Robiginitomaculum sp.]|nr:MAG: SAM-dependent methyltransferase [Robiginitomaculum sp.]
MGFYQRHILPCLLDCACSGKPFRKQREKIVPLAHGNVVEIGIGSGHNLPFYDQSKITKLTGIDPDEYIWKRSRKKRAQFHKPLERLGLSGEDIPLPDHYADTVVVTYSLCTIPDPVKALCEMRRILKPDGQLLFSEHGKAPDVNVQKWQARIDPLWSKISGGCFTGRDIPSFLAQSGFQTTDLQQAYIPGPKALAYNYWGSASPAH